MLVHRARDRSTRLLDFFVTVPSGGADPATMDAVDVPFDSETTQLFLIGPASVAVPGRRAGSSLRTGASARCRGASSSRPRSTSRASASR